MSKVRGDLLFNLLPRSIIVIYDLYYRARQGGNLFADDPIYAFHNDPSADIAAY